MSNAETSETVLLRLRPQDTPIGVSSATFAQLMSQTGLNKTEVIHFALRQLADRFLPRYELDDGPLTDAQMDTIRTLNPDMPEERITKRLF